LFIGLISIILVVAMPTSESGTSKLLRAVSTIYGKRATGNLVVSQPQKHHWVFHFHQGRLVWASGQHHRVRRWRRAVKLFAPQWDYLRYVHELGYPQWWEIQFLSRGIGDGALARQVPEIIRRVLYETLFVASSSSTLSFKWQPYAGDLPGFTGLSFGLVQATADQVALLHHEWDRLGLDASFVDTAPLLKLGMQGVNANIGSSSFLNLQPLLNGKRTFWDVAAAIGDEESVTVKILRHFLRQGLLEFTPLADVEPVPSQARPCAEAPLVLCIDDSQSVGQTVRKILTDADYRCVHVMDPVQAIPKALELKPQLILLDLVMPIANGYEVCAQLRRIEALAEVPIVILTSRDGMVDRVRARVVKATDFMGKPVKATTLVAMVDRYLRSQPPKKVTNLGTPHADANPVGDRVLSVGSPVPCS
jgi:chemotaxis family two-component system response regulator PixG